MSEIAAEREEVLSPGDLIQARREELANAWEKHLAGIVGTSSFGGGRAGPASHDLLSMVAEAASKSAEFTDSQSEALVSQLESSGIGLADLYAQIEALKNAFQTVFGETENRYLAATERIVLDRAAYELIRRKAALHEQAMELGPIGVAELDASGEILYANAAMSRLLGSASGHLASLFQESDRAHVERSLNSPEKGPGPLELNVRRTDGAANRIFLDVRPLPNSQTAVSAYATAIDIAGIVAREERFLDRLSLAAIKLNRDFVVTYANQAAKDLLGSEIDIRGRSVYDVIPSTRAQSEQFEKRSEGAAAVYEAEIVRPLDGRRIPVSVAGTPILDEDGRFLGSLGLLRSLETERAAAAIHAAIDSEHDEKRMLSALADIIRPLVPFDYCGITRFSDESDHAALWFGQAEGEPVHLSRRWWPIEPGRKKEYQQEDNSRFRRIYPDVLCEPRGGFRYREFPEAGLSVDAPVSHHAGKPRGSLHQPGDQGRSSIHGGRLQTAVRFTGGAGHPDGPLLPGPQEIQVPARITYCYFLLHNSLRARRDSCHPTRRSLPVGSHLHRPRVEDRRHLPPACRSLSHRRKGTFQGGVSAVAYGRRFRPRLPDSSRRKYRGCSRARSFGGISPGLARHLVRALSAGHVGRRGAMGPECRGGTAKRLFERRRGRGVVDSRRSPATLSRGSHATIFSNRRSEAPPTRVLITDLRGNVTWANPASVKMVGAQTPGRSRSLRTLFQRRRTATRMFGAPAQRRGRWNW